MLSLLQTVNNYVSDGTRMRVLTDSQDIRVQSLVQSTEDLLLLPDHNTMEYMMTIQDQEQTSCF